REVDGVDERVADDQHHHQQCRRNPQVVRPMFSDLGEDAAFTRRAGRSRNWHGPRERRGRVDCHGAQARGQDLRCAISVLMLLAASSAASLTVILAVRAFWTMFGTMLFMISVDSGMTGNG